METRAAEVSVDSRVDTAELLTSSYALSVDQPDDSSEITIPAVFGTVVNSFAGARRRTRARPASQRYERERGCSAACPRRRLSVSPSLRLGRLSPPVALDGGGDDENLQLVRDANWGSTGLSPRAPPVPRLPAKGKNALHKARALKSAKKGPRNRNARFRGVTQMSRLDAILPPMP